MWAVIFIVGFGAYKGYQHYDAKVLEPRRRLAELDAVAEKVAAHNLNYMLSSAHYGNDNDSRQKRLTAESGADNNAESNTEVILRKGFDIGKVLQETFGTVRELPPYLPLSEVLQADHPVNTEIKSAFKAHRAEPFHTGPFAHQLDDDEWAYVQNAYKESLQARLNARIHAESHVRAVEGFETEIRRELGEYVKARRELENENNSDPFAQEFDDLMNDENGNS